MAGSHMQNDRLKQSIVFWCFNIAGEKWSLEKICQVANELGCESIELLETEEDLIRRTRLYKDYIGHIHTAGSPGRCELDDKQEIAFRPLMDTLVDIGYQGYVGHEYIPTRDPYQSLKEAVALCRG